MSHASPERQNTRNTSRPAKKVSHKEVPAVPLVSVAAVSPPPPQTGTPVVVQSDPSPNGTREASSDPCVDLEPAPASTALTPAARAAHADNVLPSTNLRMYGACKVKDDQVLYTAIQNGAEVNWHNPDRNDCTALMAAADEGWLTGTRLLLEAGADVNGQAMNGQTALHFAAINNFTMLAELLLAYNADHSLTTSAGETAADLASVARHEKIVLMIEGAAMEFAHMSLVQLEGAFAETQECCEVTKTFGVEAKEDMVQFELARDDAVLRRAMAQREAKEAAEEQIEHKAAILESENWKANAEAKLEAAKADEAQHAAVQADAIQRREDLLKQAELVLDEAEAADVARKEAVARRNQAKTIADQADEDIARFEALRLANHERMTQAIKAAEAATVEAEEAASDMSHASDYLFKCARIVKAAGLKISKLTRVVDEARRREAVRLEVLRKAQEARLEKEIRERIARDEAEQERKWVRMEALEQATTIMMHDSALLGTNYSKYLGQEGVLKSLKGFEKLANQITANIDPDAPLRQPKLMGVNAETARPRYIQTLRKEFVKAVGPTDKILAQTAADISSELIKGPCKEAERVFEKAKLCYKMDVRRVSDYERRLIKCRDFATMTTALKAIDAGLDILRLKNRFALRDKMAKSTARYRDCQLLVRVRGSELIMEVQLHLEIMLVVQQKLADIEDDHGRSGQERYIEFRNMRDTAELL